MLKTDIRKKLEELAEEKYASFSASLIPHCQEKLLGVRIPTLRKIAKDIIKKGQGLEYLKLKGDLLFEEKMLKMLIFGNLKLDIDSKLNLAPSLIAEITNWSLCDSFCNEFKELKNHREKLWAFLAPLWGSKNTYALRVAIVLSLFYLIEEAYLPLLFAKFNEVESQDYYVQMALAWATSMCFVKFEKETLHFLQANDLDVFTHNKALQKIRESLQVSKNLKEEIKSLRR